MAAPSTLKEIRERVQVDLDLQEEVFILDAEINNFINDGIREAEAEILTVGPELQNYFLTKKTLDTVAGQAEYKVPSDMYADKIRSMTYNEGGFNIHKITPVRDLQDIPYLNLSGQNNRNYQYVFTQALKGTRLNLFPTPDRTTTGGAITIWYVRNARSLETDTDVCDIPEFVNFIIQYAKVECMKKEGHPNLGVVMGDFEKQRELMINTLRNRIIDDENEIQPDMRFYADTMYE